MEEDSSCIHFHYRLHLFIGLILTAALVDLVMVVAVSTGKRGQRGEEGIAGRATDADVQVDCAASPVACSRTGVHKLCQIEHERRSHVAVASLSSSFLFFFPSLLSGLINQWQ